MFIKGKLSNKQVNETRRYVLADLLIWSEVHLVSEFIFDQQLCVSYFNELILGSFGNEPVNKIRHYVLVILPCLLRDNYLTNNLIKADTMC